MRQSGATDVTVSDENTNYAVFFKTALLQHWEIATQEIGVVASVEILKHPVVDCKLGQALRINLTDLTSPATKES